MLTIQGLSHWIYGDGTFVKGGGIYLQTQSFTVIEVVRLINVRAGRSPIEDFYRRFLNLTVNVLFIIKKVNLLFILVVVLFGNYVQNCLNICQRA